MSHRFAEESEDFDPYHGPAPIPIEKLNKYKRGDRINYHGIKSKLHRIDLMKADKKFRKSVRDAARNELLLTEQSGYIEVDDNEDTYRLKQHEIAAEVDILSASKLFDLSLKDFGPYKIDYSRDGRHLLLGGRLGHVAAFDWVTKVLECEINVMESVHDICWLHLPTMFATAQKEWVYIYDTDGIELHCLKIFHRVLQLEFLPYHFLLATASEKGFLTWLDITMGKLVQTTYTNSGRLNIMTQNPYNAIVATAHAYGSVKMWSPNVEDPLATIFCHNCAIKALAIDSRGLYMATAGADRSLKIYDVRMFKCLQTYKLGRAAGFLKFSQKEMLAVGMQNIVEVYKDCCSQTATSPYLRHEIAVSTISDLQFPPFEDVLGIGRSKGFSSILIPGAGHANFDTYESNPFMTNSQRKEMEVKSLLEKIQPELITLDPSHLGKVNVPSLKEKLEKMKSIPYVKPPRVEFEVRPRTKGRNKSAKVFKRKKIVKEAAKRELVKSAMAQKKEKMAHKTKTKTDVLNRFVYKKK